MIWFWIYLGGMASWFVVYSAFITATDDDDKASLALLVAGAVFWPATYLIMLGSLIGTAIKPASK